MGSGLDMSSQSETRGSDLSSNTASHPGIMLEVGEVVEELEARLGEMSSI